MALATRPKTTVTHKKRRAQHHRHSKSYLGTYWPYLPMLAIVGAGVIANMLWSAGALPGVNSATPASFAVTEQLTRIQALTGSQAVGVLNVTIIITATAFAIFMFRHWRRLHRFINTSEEFVYRHAWLDITTVLVFTVGFLLTRPNGFVS